jgi:hypothetical protein
MVDSSLRLAQGSAGYLTSELDLLVVWTVVVVKLNFRGAKFRVGEFLCLNCCLRHQSLSIVAAFIVGLTPIQQFAAWSCNSRISR